MRSITVQLAALCSGNTASVTKIKDGQQERVFTVLPSLAIQPSGIEGAGSQDIKFDSKGNASGVYGFADAPATRETVFKDSAFGQLYKLDPITGPVSLKTIGSPSLLPQVAAASEDQVLPVA